MIEYSGDARGVAKMISESAAAVIKSKLVVDGERDELIKAHARFVSSTSDLIETLDDELKPVLARALIGAFEIGSKATASESSVRFAKRTQAASGRNAKARKAEPREIAIQEAISVALNGRTVSNHFSKETAAIYADVNVHLESKGHQPVKVDVIRRRLENLSSELRT